MLANLSDEELIELYRTERRQDAFALLASRYVGKLRQIVARILRDRNAADDVVQEAFLVITTHLDNFDPAKSTFRKWLFWVAERRCYLELQRRRREAKRKVAA